MSRRLKSLILIFVIGLFFLPISSFARNPEDVIDWYIQDFDSKIIVNKDSTLDITEKITADCGNLAGKHGIFRILPEFVNIEGKGKVKTPVELVSITDFEGNPLEYAESKDSFDGTVTWKIGDPDKTVQGLNYYKIHYIVKNAIRFDNQNFDEFYWNLNGNFWEIETDKFHASIVFPEEVKSESSTVDYYTGLAGSKSNDLAVYRWTAPNILEFDSTRNFLVGEGVTASVTFPKNIFTPYQFGFFELYGKYLFLIIPIITFFVCFYFWGKYGKDPKIDKTVIAQYEAPGNLTPLEIGMLMTNGSFSNKMITAEIINLATKKLITIKETHNKVLFFDSKDYELTKNENQQEEKNLTKAEKLIFDKIFEDGDVVGLSSLKDNFYKVLKDVQSETSKLLETKKLIVTSSQSFQMIFLVLGIVFMAISFFIGGLSIYLAISLFFSGLFLLFFSFIMPKRTPVGAELNWQIKGFKIFMETVDKHRAEFYEKENIFEKFLPYAIVFGITKIWIQKMKEIYGEDFYATHAPVWFVGNAAAFNADSFSSTIDSLSSSIAASTSSPSGSGGSGSSGGGGGGGGGGGW